jgi:hypothetical protein
MNRLMGFAVVACLADPVFATDYLYQMTAPNDPNLSAGSIVTDCDNCVVGSDNVVAWSLYSGSVGVQGLLTSSSIPGSSVMIQGSSGLIATPSGLFYDFTYTTNDAVRDTVAFTSPTHRFVELSNYMVVGDPTAPYGSATACGPVTCASATETGDLQIGKYLSLAAPEMSTSGVASALTLLWAGMAILGARRPKILR